MSLTYSGGGVMPTPQLAWDFQSSNVDYVSGISPTTSVGPPTYNSGGKYGTSIVFNNTPGASPGAYYLKYTTSISLSTATGFTICAWIKPLAIGANSTGSQRYLAISDSQTFFFFGTNSSGSTMFLYGQNPFSVPNVIQGAEQTVTESQWIHASIVFSGTSITTYYNAVKKDNLSLVVSPVTFTALSLGNRAAINADQAAKCEIDDLRIYNTALTATQVQSIYNQNGVPGRVFVNTNSRQIYVGPTGTYPSYTPTSGAQFPVFNTSNVSFYSSGGTSGGAVGQYLDFGSQRFNMSSGFSAVCQFAWTNGIGVWERIIDFGIGTNNNNILITRTGTSTNLLFSYRRGGTEYAVTAFGAISAQNTIYTVVAIYDPSKPLLSLYVNGNLTTSVPAVVATDTRTLSRTYVARSNWGSDAYSNVNINYLSIYNRVLTSDEINSPLPTPQITFKGAPLFTQLSTSATSSAVGAFSLRAVNGTVAKAVQVRNGTTSAIQDFYADRLGNLLTAPVTGRTLANWLAGGTGYVTTWYDQSGRGNHATQATAANQPIITRATKGPGYACLFNGANSQVLSCAAGTYSLLNGTKYAVCVTERRNNSGTQGGYFGIGSTGGGGAGLIVGYFNSDTTMEYSHRGDNLDNTVAAFAGASEPIRYTVFDYSASTTKRVYINSSILPVTNTSYDLVATSGAMTIGKSFATGNGTYYYGEIYEVLVFTKSLYDLDGTSTITQIYNNQVGAYGT